MVLWAQKGRDVSCHPISSTKNKMIFGRLSGTWLVPYVCITEAMGIKLSVNNDLFMVIHFVNTKIDKKGLLKMAVVIRLNHIDKLNI